MPDSSWWETQDPVFLSYLYEHWANEQEYEYDLARSLAILVGSFTNPEAAQKMLKDENPDFESSDEDFKKSMQMVEEDAEKAEKQKSKRRKRRIVRDVNG